MWIAGVCEHGKVLAGIGKQRASEDELREFAAAHYRLEERPLIQFDGGCGPCKVRYEANCRIVGIEP